MMQLHLEPNEMKRNRTTYNPWRLTIACFRNIFLVCATAQYYLGYYGPGFTSQYHVRDVLEQVSYGFSHPGQVASHYGDVFVFAYINPVGKEVMVFYTADRRGYSALRPTTCPKKLLLPPPSSSQVYRTRGQKEASASRTKRQVPVYPAALSYTPYTPAYYPVALPAVRHVAP
ncbi:LOW QUALITY PROTEIN: hypothetical protein DAPPUDRAFT_264771 [Daphnia pulex]|uniref:Uncharacterized protein n=1 Tax=Daphnia pulex TaxID=6669 RepID=E9HSA7_DAPPU|nr:LOW QUALITY PROTEIN: hypothetical protein DAPPUDRAFT_264771 [Daphnia pulex]|eukprot:EFX65375.1 LOW QUALITY PROTEIN: hypothetical protein DAPPUDRAFT_264771 [Daphnia pulex]